MKYLCLACGAKFEDKLELNKHLRLAHEPPMLEFRVVVSSAGAVVAEGITTLDAAIVRACVELERAPGARLRIDTRDSAGSEWLPKLDLSGYG
jgi:hypothetical protein